MPIEPTRSEPPRTDWPETIRAQVAIWQGMASAAADIAHAKRTIYLAYVAEGFTELQAMELVKST